MGVLPTPRSILGNMSRVPRTAGRRRGRTGFARGYDNTRFDAHEGVQAAAPGRLTTPYTACALTKPGAGEQPIVQAADLFRDVVPAIRT